MNQELLLVNDKDEIIDYGEKWSVHRNANLHRAFSIFVLDAENRFLLQKRASKKYHSGGLWTNACCSHPIRGENMELTVHRRLREEMGFDCDLEYIFSFIYHTALDNDLTEYEFDHIYLGRFNGTPNPNPDEASDWKWVDINDLKADLALNPTKYTYWLNHAFSQYYDEFSVDA